MFVRVGNDENASGRRADVIEREFGMRVRALRNARGWTQDRLAAEMTRRGFAMHQTTIAKLESASRPTTLGELSELARLFRVNPLELMDLNAAVARDSMDFQARLRTLDAHAVALEHERQDVAAQLGMLRARHEAIDQQLAEVHREQSAIRYAVDHREHADGEH